MRRAFPPVVGARANHRPGGRDWPLGVLVGLVGVLWAWAAGCSGLARPQLCGEIPPDGCPIGRGGTCDDELCAALYDCVEGRWRLVEECPDNLVGGSGGQAGAGHGAAPGGAGGQGGVGVGGEGGCEGATIDRTGEVDGCTPELQVPDCEATIAESCHPCRTGCLDFFLCMAPGWVLVAYCDEHGQLVVL